MIGFLKDKAENFKIIVNYLIDITKMLGKQFEFYAAYTILDISFINFFFLTSIDLEKKKEICNSRFFENYLNIYKGFLNIFYKMTIVN